MCRCVSDRGVRWGGGGGLVEEVVGANVHGERHPDHLNRPDEDHAAAATQSEMEIFLVEVECIGPYIK